VSADARKWPGLDGWVLIALSAVLLGVYLGRGRLGGEYRLLLALAANATWLAATWWTRRRLAAGAEEP